MNGIPQSGPWRKRVDIGDAVLLLGDCMEILPVLPKVDALITDPPYSERTHSSHAATASRSPSDFGSDNSERKDLTYQCLTVEGVQKFATTFNNSCSGWIVWMCDHHLAVPIQSAQEAMGRYVFAPLPYYAPGSRTRLGGDGPASWTIWIVVSRTAAQHRWGTLPGGYVAGAGWRDRTYIGGKPVQLMERIVADYSREGDLVCDPCCGSGTTGMACANLGRPFIGIESDESAFNNSCERITAAHAQGRLFQ